MAALLLSGCGGGDDQPQPRGNAGAVDEAALEAAMAHIGERDAERVALFKLGDRGDDEEAFTLTFENLRDDSVRDERHRLRLRRDTGEWRVVEDEVMYRCHEGRGQQEFAAGLCG